MTVFAPLPEEYDYVADEIDGTLPEGLRGTLYRIGPGKWEVGGTPLRHLFDGDGMVSQFTIDGGRVRFRNRYVRTGQFKQGLTSGELRRPGLGTPANGFAGMRPPANVANTNIAYHADRLLALWEGGRPHRLDPDTLETLGTYDFDGRLKFAGAFSAHPKWDPDTGEMFNFAMLPGLRPALRCYRVDRNGRLHTIATVRIDANRLNHDFALTKRHLVFVLDPTVINLRKMLRPSTALWDALEHRPEKAARFVLVPRDGGRPRVVEHEATVHFHLTNAYEDGTDTVVDMVRFDDWGELAAKVYERTPDLSGSRLVRYRVGPNGVSEEELTPFTSELPQYDWRRTARRHRFTYLTGRAAEDGESAFSHVLKIDHDSGKVTAHPVGARNVAGEPLFVPRADDSAEDDGWLLVVAYDAAEHRSRLLVLDAADLERDPLATVHLRHHIPFGFHGTFTRRVAAPGSPIPHPDRLPVR